MQGPRAAGRAFSGARGAPIGDPPGQHATQAAAPSAAAPSAAAPSAAAPSAAAASAAAPSEAKPPPSKPAVSLDGMATGTPGHPKPGEFREREAPVGAPDAPEVGARWVGGHGGASARVPMSARDAVRKNLFVNTLEISQRFSHDVGIPRGEADALAQYLTQLLCEHKERLSEMYVETASLQRTMIDLESRIASTRAELLKSQEMSLGQVQQGLAQLQQDVKTLRVEFKHEVDKLQSAQRLDINLEKGNTREELRKMSEATHQQDQRFERELNSVRTLVEASKNDMIRWFVGMMGSVLLIAASMLRMLGKW